MEDEARLNFAPLTHVYDGRSRKAGATIAAIWLGLLLLWWAIDLAEWIIALLLAATLPAALEFARGKVARFRLDDQVMEWQSGRVSGTVALAKITQVRLETRWDLSVRVRILADGQRITLPQDCVPPHRALEAALEQRGVAVSRHHFGI